MGAAASVEMAEENKEAMDATKAFLADKEACKAAWSKVDFNGNGIVSVAEMDKFIGESANPESEVESFGNLFSPVIDTNTGKPKQPVLIRAWKKCTSREYSTHDDGFIHRHEFRAFVKYILLYNSLFQVFDEINGDDRRIDIDEFKAGMTKFGACDEDTDLDQTFKNIDSNGGGQILFDEFCHYCLCMLDV